MTFSRCTYQDKNENILFSASQLILEIDKITQKGIVLFFCLYDQVTLPSRFICIHEIILKSLKSHKDGQCPKCERTQVSISDFNLVFSNRVFYTK